MHVDQTLKSVDISKGIIFSIQQKPLIFLRDRLIADKETMYY